MQISITAMSPVMGAQVDGLDLNALARQQPPDPRFCKTLNKALEEHIVLCIRSQNLDPEQLVTAARIFGTPLPQVNEHLQFPEQPQIGIISSTDTDAHGSGKRVIAGTTWHTDHSFVATPPKATMLFALVTPPTGGETSFCNMRAAYRELAPTLRERIDRLRAVHSYQSSRSPRKMLTRSKKEQEKTPDVVHPLVRVHPGTGEKALYMSTTRLDHIVGMSREQSDALIDELLAHATQPRFLYDHQWQTGDLVIWDNRCSMHHANANYPADARRLLHRVIIEGEPPIAVSA